MARRHSWHSRPVIPDYIVEGTDPANGDITLNINVPPVATAITITRDDADAFPLDFKDHFSDEDETDETTHMITFTFDVTATAATSGLGISGTDLASGTYTVTDPANTIQFTVTETSPTRTVDLSHTVRDANSDTDDTGTIAISIDIPPPPQTCENSQAGTLDFGSLEDGGTSDERTLAIRNTGNADSSITISATGWTVAGTILMGAGQTRVGTDRRV